MKKDLDNKMLFGVCSGISNHFEVDVTVIRFLFVLATLLGIGTPILIYLVLALIMASK